VARYSAQMDKRQSRVVKSTCQHLPVDHPINWNGATFLPRDHIGLTKDEVFADNLLFKLLESPR